MTGITQYIPIYSLCFAVAPILGFLLIVIGLAVTVFCWRTRRQQQPTSQQRTCGEHRYDCSINALSYPSSTSKNGPLPQYNLPMDPPAYSSDAKEGEYTYTEPPSYTEEENRVTEHFENPAYEPTSENDIVFGEIEEGLENNRKKS